ESGCAQVLSLTAILQTGGTDGPHSGRRSRENQTRNRAGPGGGGGRGGAETARQGSDRALPVPRRQDTEPGRVARQESLELPGCVSGGRERDRLDGEGGVGERPSR